MGGPWTLQLATSWIATTPNSPATCYREGPSVGASLLRDAETLATLIQNAYIDAESEDGALPDPAYALAIAIMRRFHRASVAFWPYSRRGDRRLSATDCEWPPEVHQQEWSVAARTGECTSVRLRGFLLA